MSMSNAMIFSCRGNGNDYNMFIYNSPNATSLTALGSGATQLWHSHKQEKWASAHLRPKVC